MCTLSQNMFLALVLCTASALACDSGPKASPKQSSLPPPGSGGTGKGTLANPHAGAEPANPHAGGAHAGMDPQNPHAGMGGEGAQPTELDPKQVIAGTILLDARLKDKVKPENVLFLSVRPADPKTGEPSGGPVAVDRFAAQSLPVTFQIDNTKGMGGSPTHLEGRVVVRAWIDADGDAARRTPGDIEGKAVTDVPNREVKIVLDTLVE